ncbi:monocarboxylate transporter 14-like [Argopecten irradians]|uniref:monocarboxylate transporter 14-like n=1 Tax=Argopecten irradians TaxID=31199 RepID=UPI00371A930D
MDDSAGKRDIQGSNRNELGGLSNKPKDTNIFPTGTYRKISETTSISDSVSQQLNNTTNGKSSDVKHRKWIVLISSFMILFICAGLPFNMAVLNIAFLEEFGKSKAETALVQSVSTGMFFIAGFPMGTAVSIYGTRKVGICGGFLAFVGTLLSFFMPNLHYLIVTLGFTTGIGFSACYISASTSVGEYFDGKTEKLLALSFASFGSGFGSISFTYLLDVLIREYGWRGCLLVVSGIVANMIPGFAVCKPRNVGVSMNDGNNGTMRSLFKRCFPCFQPKYENKNRLSVVSTVSTASSLPITRKDETLLTKLKTLRNNKIYILFTCSMVIALPSVNGILVFLVNALQTKGFDSSSAVFLYFFMNLISTVFRIVPGLCKKIPHVSVLAIPVFFVSIGAVACALLPGARTYEEHLVLLGMLGAMLGGTVTLLSVTTMKLVGMKNYSTGLGVLITAIGISNTCAGPVSGYIRDTTGSYTMSFYTVSGSLVVAICFYVAAAVTRKCQRDDSENIQKYLDSGRRGTRRRSSVLPWKGKVEFMF